MFSEILLVTFRMPVLVRGSVCPVIADKDIETALGSASSEPTIPSSPQPLPNSTHRALPGSLSYRLMLEILNLSNSKPAGCVASGGTSSEAPCFPT